MSKNVNWAGIKRRWIAQGGAGLRAMGRDFGVAHTTISRRAARERWGEKVTESRSFLYRGELFKIADPNYNLLRSAWERRIQSRVRKERILDEGDIVGAWLEAVQTAVSSYKYGGAEGFDKLITRAWSRRIIDLASTARRRRDHEVPVEILTQFPAIFRPMAFEMSSGTSESEIMERYHLSPRELKVVRARMASCLKDSEAI